MPKLSNKAQFFILTSVIVVGVFFTLSKYVNEYSFIDTSKAVEGSEVFMFENIKAKAIKTVEISNPGNVRTRMSTYKDVVEDMSADRGYKLVFNYKMDAIRVHFNMSLISEKYTLKSDFWEFYIQSCDELCVNLGYTNGVCEQNPMGQCTGKGGDHKPEGDELCTGGEDADTCCCFPS